MLYREQFPDFDDDATPAALLALGFEDTSWRNDICPNFTRGDVVAWVDYVDVSKREFQGAELGPRLTLHLCEEGQTREVVCMTDDAAAFVQSIGDAIDIALI